MNLMEWEVGIPGKASVSIITSVVQSFAKSSCLAARFKDSLGGWHLQTFDDLSGRYVFDYVHVSDLYSDISSGQITPPSHLNVCFGNLNALGSS